MYCALHFLFLFFFLFKFSHLACPLGCHFYRGAMEVANPYRLVRSSSLTSFGAFLLLCRRVLIGRKEQTRVTAFIINFRFNLKSTQHSSFILSVVTSQIAFTARAVQHLDTGDSRRLNLNR